MVTEIDVIRAIGDTICVVISVAIDICVTLIPEPAIRGFVCQDESIRYKIEEGHRVSLYMLLFIFVFLPLIIVIMWELAEFPWSDEETANSSACGRACQSAIVYIFSMSISHGICTVIALLLGRLRPDFLDICRPNVDCRDTRFHYVYIENYKCTGSEKEVKKARMSFPSTAASVTSQSMVYLVLLVEAKWQNPSMFLIKRFLQVVFISGFISVSASVVAESKCHLSDAFAGAIFGTLFAFYTAFCMTNWFKKQPQPLDDNDSAVDTRSTNSRSRSRV